MNIIADIDPEFILQVAYYVRNQMYIKSESNFILAFSALHPKTKPYCSTYMCPTMLIPGDLIEVCQFVQLISNQLKSNNQLDGSTNIRKQLFFPKYCKSRFKRNLPNSIFINLKYQQILNPDIKNKIRENRLLRLKQIREVLKYQRKDVQEQFNKRAIQRTNQRRKNMRNHKHDYKIQENLTVFDINFLHLKDIIKFSHVNEPRSLVMSILGAQYPKAQEEFEKVLRPKIRADNIVVLSDLMVTRGFSKGGQRIQEVFQKYLKTVNSDAKLFFMDISAYGQQISFGDDLKTKNCFLINGMSENVLKYIYYAGKIYQLEDVVALVRS
ncbi:unnamed protein product [Paramecium primaurelia]|uniref:TROVE domain-containing protein n=1 Tax=Paramecium primaurelia TaxID=5886 RepID=A0A8S1NFK1_PARPR|nr:unnamed protein product [Paramecium primaurelia]